jgi:hypothetical protein
MEGRKMTKKRMFATFIVSMAIFGTIATSALAQPQYPTDYVEKELYTAPVYAYAGDWIRCSVANYFPDAITYAEFTIYYQDGTVAWPAPTEPPAQPYEIPSWGAQYTPQYSVTNPGAYWCKIKVSKPNDPKYVGWGNGGCSYQPAALDYEAVHIPAYYPTAD